MTKFENVPVEDDVTILFHSEAMLGDFEILYQKWHWQSIKAESIIFANEDVQDMDDGEIEKLVRTSPMVKEDSVITVKRVSGFCFVNFNFDTEDIDLTPAQSA